MTAFLGKLFTDFWVTMTEMSPYLLFGFLVAGILSVFISTDFVERHLASKSRWGIGPVVKASLFGVPLPLCSCGVIPVAMSLRKHGASRGASISFLLSTPQTGVDSLFVTYSLLGPIFAIIRPLIAFITGIIGGVAVHGFAEGFKNDQTGEQPPASDQCQDECCRDKKAAKLPRIFKHGFVTLPRDIGKPMLAGLIVAALIAALVPDDFFAEKIGTGFTAMVLMLLLGIPVYVCATASVPVAAVLIAKGLTPGAALVFLMTGPATNAAAFATIWKIMGTRTAVIYLLTVVFCALGSGLALDAFFPQLAVEVAEHMHEMGATLFGHITAVVLLLVLLGGIVSKRQTHDEH